MLTMIRSRKGSTSWGLPGVIEIQTTSVPAPAGLRILGTLVQHVGPESLALRHTP
jgi:hypothetical protein